MIDTYPLTCWTRVNLIRVAAAQPNPTNKKICQLGCVGWLMVHKCKLNFPNRPSCIVTLVPDHSKEDNNRLLCKFYVHRSVQLAKDVQR